jgi:hypothetical protein
VFMLGSLIGGIWLVWHGFNLFDLGSWNEPSLPA